MPEHWVYMTVILLTGIALVLLLIWMNRRSKRRVDQVEARLLENQRVMQCAENLAQVGRWSMDPETLAIEWADETYRLYGYQPGDVAPSLALNERMVHPEDWPRLIAAMYLGLQTHQSQVCDCRITRPDGAVRHLRIAGAFDHESRSVARRVVGSVQDITVLRRTEEALRQSAERYRNILDSIEEGYYEIDRNGCLLFFNQSMQRILGYTAPEMLGMHYSAYLAAESVEQGKMFFRAALETDTVQTFTGKIKRKEGSEVYVETSISTILNAAGQATGFRGLVRDVTARVSAEASQRQLEEQMWYAQKLESLGVLAGGIAHDFNNLLTTILGNAEFVADELPPSSPARVSLDQMVTAGTRAAELARQMLAYSGRSLFEVRRLSVNDLIRDMGDLLAASVPKKVVLAFDLDGKLPQTQADVSQLRQVVMNLISNAAEALGDHEGHIRVRTSLAWVTAGVMEGSPLKMPLDGGAYVSLEVTDTGCGMTPEVVERIFDPFFTTKFTGRGLGLSVVLGIVRGHHGGLQVLSSPGEGTTFRVFFPAINGEVIETAPAVDLSNDGLWRGEGTLLLADDEGALRELGKRMLERLGFQVVAVADGVAAVARFQESPEVFRAVMLDMTMPCKNGREALLELRALRPGLPALIVSGYSEEETMGQFGPMDRVCFLQKPYTRAGLIKVLRNVLALENPI